MSSSELTATLIVATYEMPRHLALVCAGLERQTLDPSSYEIFFCDDGSGAETARVIQDFKARARARVEHVWQEHQGFRKCRMLNEALRRSRGRTLVFLDGDCVPHKDYIKDHVTQQEPGRYLAGRRVELGRDYSENLTPDRVRAGLLDRPRFSLLHDVWFGESEFFQRSVRVPFAPLRRVLGMARVADLKGCNYSVAREALIAINGFDEEYEGYGREDTDVELRLQNLGLRIKSMKGLALQYHVWHPRREFTPSNDVRLEDVKRTGRVRCERGMELRA